MYVIMVTFFFAFVTRNASFSSRIMDYITLYVLHESLILDSDI